MPTMKKLFLPVIAILITLAIGAGLKSFLTPALHHPYLIVDGAEGIRLTILQLGQSDAGQCNRAVSALISAIQSSCPLCKIVQSTCTSELDAAQRQWFGESPLQIPSARMASGITLYESTNSAFALLACQESERIAASNPPDARVICQPANTPRPLPVVQSQKIDQCLTAYDFFRLGALVLALVLTALLWNSYAINRRSLLAVSERQTSGSARYSHLPRFSWTQRLTVAGMDAFLLFAAFALLVFPGRDDFSAWFRFDIGSVTIHIALVGFTVSWFWVVLEHYHRRRPFWDELREVLHVVFISLLLASMAVVVTGADISRVGYLMTWGIAFVLVPLGRVVSRSLLDWLGLWKLPAVIIGTGDNARKAYLAIKDEHALGYCINAFLRPSSIREHESEKGTRLNDPTTVREEILDIVVLQIGNDIRTSLQALGNPIVIIALDDLDQRISSAIVKAVGASQLLFHFIPQLRELPLLDADLSPFLNHELALLTVKNNLKKRTFQWIKRCVDLAFAIPGIILAAPLIGIAALSIYSISRGNPFYFQRREGYRGRDIMVWKLRTMYVNADRLLGEYLQENPVAKKEWETFYKLSEDPRILPGIGNFLRRTSIDELPQLWNVIMGDLSLVGPRPFPHYHLDAFSEDFREIRREVKPGITGIWQISARSEGNLESQEHFDTYYIRNWSIWLDLYILWRTVDTVLLGRGAK